MRPAVLIALLATLPPLAAWAVFGVIWTPDSPGYAAYADQILAHAVPAGQALLRSGPSPISLFRAPGLPLLLALLRRMAGPHWPGLLVALQIAVGAALAVAGFHGAARLGCRTRLAIAAALLPAAGFMVVVQLCVLTDAFYAALAAGAAFTLLRPGWRPAALAGLMLAAATALREATPFLALFYLPAALILPRRLPRAAAVLAPPVCIALTLAAWNLHRIGQPILTTSRQIVMVQAVLPLLARHLPIYDGADPFDRIARETVGAGEYSLIDTLNRRLFTECGLSAPQIAALAGQRYWRAWHRFPAAMATTVLSRIRPEFLTMPVQPLDTVGALLVYARWPRPRFDRLNILWAGLRHGRLADGGWILADIVLRLAGLSVFLAALAAPFRRRDARLWGLWCVCAGFFAVYLPVHIETRYLVPIVPLTSVLAATCITRRHP